MPGQLKDVPLRFAKTGFAETGLRRESLASEDTEDEQRVGVGKDAEIC